MKRFKEEVPEENRALAGCCSFFTNSFFEEKSSPDSKESIEKATLIKDEVNNSGYVVVEAQEEGKFDDIVSAFAEDWKSDGWRDALARNPDIGWNMRNQVVDWLMDMCQKFKMKRSTYHLAVEVFNRYLFAVKGLKRQQLQAIGSICLLIASKHEDSILTFEDLRHLFPSSKLMTAAKATELEICKVGFDETGFEVANLWSYFVYSFDLFDGKLG